MCLTKSAKQGSWLLKIRTHIEQGNVILIKNGVCEIEFTNKCILK